MTILLRLALALLVALSAACTTVIVQPAESKAEKPLDYREAFAIEGDPLAHIVGAFDDGHQTMVAFDTDKYAAIIAGPGGEPIAYKRVGTYAVIGDTFDRLVVWNAGHRAELTHIGSSGRHDFQFAAFSTDTMGGDLPPAGRDGEPRAAADPGGSPTQPAITAAPPPPPPAPPEQNWRTTSGLSLRAQIRRWVETTGGEYHLVDRDPDDPPEPDWRLTEEDDYSGDFLDALTWLRDGFWQAPRPDIIVTANKRIVLRAMGAAQ